MHKKTTGISTCGAAGVALMVLYLTGALTGIHWIFIFGFLLIAGHGSEYE
jgi:hypothetical protein|tara:strand:- start:656 stop:805 length:150 start_codon:yes stop_codon:yes gene_type:complete